MGYPNKTRQVASCHLITASLTRECSSGESTNVIEDRKVSSYFEKFENIFENIFENNFHENIFHENIFKMISFGIELL